ncbi:hypothetical protein CHU98_g4659 [Xylaria longipes]|nr:hypothetical protein CHU98_g4659 [Xylaria longipes]
MVQGSQHLTDEERFRVRVLHDDARMSMAQICRITGYSKSQVRRAMTAVQGPRKRKGPPPAIGPAEEAELVRFINASRRNRFLSWKKVAEEFSNGAYGEKSIRNALERLGYRRDATGQYMTTLAKARPDGNETRKTGTQSVMLYESENTESPGYAENTEMAESFGHAENTEMAESPEDMENTENARSPEDMENTENAKSPENTEDIENTENPESTESPESPEHAENTENLESPENTESTE